MYEKNRWSVVVKGNKYDVEQYCFESRRLKIIARTRNGYFPISPDHKVKAICVRPNDDYICHWGLTSGYWVCWARLDGDDPTDAQIAHIRPVLVPILTEFFNRFPEARATHMFQGDQKCTR